MSILFIFIQLISIIIFLKLKKTDKKENIVLWSTLSIITLMCFNILVTLIFNMIKIKSTLLNLSIIYMILDLSMIFAIFKTKQTQKYLIKKQDIIISLLIMIIVIIIAYAQYKFPFNIKYLITDGAVHYNAMVNFYSSSTLLKNVNSIENFNTFMTGAYVNGGILLKSLASFVTVKDCFSVFVIFDLLLFFLSGEIFYLLISKYNVKKTEYFFSFCFTLLYMLGYPLNSLLSGFVYLSLGLDIILAIIILIKNYLKSENITILIVISLSTLGLFFSYYYFVPVVYLAIFIEIVLNFKKEKRKNYIQNLIKTFYILVVPAILGMYYMFIKEMFTKKYNIPTEVLKIEGAIYKNFISNIIFFIPFIIYYYFNINCRKKDIFSKNIFILLLLFITVIFIGNKIDKVSDYYFYKLYYMLWIFTIYLAYKGFTELIYSKNWKQKLAKTLISLYFVGMIVTLMCNNSLYLWDIYNYNYQRIINDEDTYGNKYLELVEYYSKNLAKNRNDVEILNSTQIGRVRWRYVLFQNPIFLFADEELFSIENWLNNKTASYLIYSKKDYSFEPDKNDKNYEVLLDNSEGAILKRK